jgi:hypothetical protein
VISGAVRTFSDCWMESVNEKGGREKGGGGREGGTYDELVFILLRDGTPCGDLFVHERVSEPWKIKLVVALLAIQWFVS